jgi:hypothetical protein
MSFPVSLAMITADAPQFYKPCDTVYSLNFVGKKTAWEVLIPFQKFLKYFNGCLLLHDKVTEADLWELK